MPNVVNGLKARRLAPLSRERASCFQPRNGWNCEILRPPLEKARGGLYLFVKKGVCDNMVKVNLKGSVREYAPRTSIAEIAQSIGAGLYKAACVGKINGVLSDLRTRRLQRIAKWKSSLSILKKRGKGWLAYLLPYYGTGIKHLFPGCRRFGIGPAIDNGFFYDFDLPRSLTPEDLEKNPKAEMKKIIKQNLPLSASSLSPGRGENNDGARRANLQGRAD